MPFVGLAVLLSVDEPIEGEDGVTRCGWAHAAPEFPAYHDTEWGFPVDDDQRLFEKLCLEGFQSGLSWRTILAKRDNFRAAFHNFDFHQVATFGSSDVERLVQDAGIIRHRGKIEATINNAARAVALVDEVGSLSGFLWQFEPEVQPAPHTQTMSPESVALSKELKRRGWKFVGPTTMYAFMQAMGMVNDHLQGCDIRAAVERSRAAFRSPALAPLG